MALRRVSLPAPQPLVRPVRLEDTDRLARLFDGLGHPASAEEVRARLYSSPAWRQVLVAELELEVVGMATVELLHPVHRRSREAMLTGLVTDPGCRHRGVARALVATALAWARREGCLGLFARAPARADAARGFFQAVGFDETHLTFDWRLP